MPSATLLNKNIQFLINVNYQRMMSFEHAAFLTSEPSFKKFYTEKAEESEINIRQLYLMLNVSHPAAAVITGLEHLKTDQFVSSMFHGKKSTIKILAAMQSIDKTIAKWYTTTMKEIKDLPEEVVTIVDAQYKLLNKAQLQMAYL